MTKLVARGVGDDGHLGATLATALYDGDDLVHDGDSTVIRDQLRVMAAAGRRTEREAFDLLAGEPWSNGKVWIGAAE